jgi:hypothetical protein
MAPSSFKPGKALLTLASVITMIGPYIADWKYVTSASPSLLLLIPTVRQSRLTSYPQRNPRPKPNLAAARTFPQRADNVYRRLPRPHHAILSPPCAKFRPPSTHPPQLCPPPNTRLLHPRHERHLVPQCCMDGSRVWRWRTATICLPCFSRLGVARVVGGEGEGDAGRGEEGNVRMAE